MFLPSSSRSRFAHLPRIFARASVILLPLAVLVVFVAFHARRNHDIQLPPKTDQQLVHSLEPFQESPLPLASRPIFPYSIVPGGVRNARELQKAASADPLVAQHYADFQISKARAIRLERPVAMFVSYRRDNRVFWTRNRMVIPAGETVLSDGENFARVRCANRLSPVAIKPVAATEPSREELNEPAFVPPLIANWLPDGESQEFPGTPSLMPFFTTPAIAPPITSTGNTPPPPILPPILIPGVPPLVQTPVPPVVTPEPGFFTLFLLGSVFIVLFTLAIRRFGPA